MKGERARARLSPPSGFLHEGHAGSFQFPRQKGGEGGLPDVEQFYSRLLSTLMIRGGRVRVTSGYEVPRKGKIVCQRRVHAMQTIKRTTMRLNFQGN